MKHLLSLLSLTTLLAFTVGCGGSNSWPDSVQDQLQELRGVVLDDGYSTLEDSWGGYLESAGRARQNLSLEAGVEYLMVGVCDMECSNLDLHLFGSEGELLREDIKLDDVPVVIFTPSIGGSYRTELSMRECLADQCFFGFAAFEREPGTKVQPAPEGEGETVMGKLGQGDDLLESGEYIDRYPLALQAGQHVTVELTSTLFDPYLILKRPNGSQIENDDFDGSNTHSRLSVNAGESGDWEIMVTSFSPGESGSYKLTHALAEGEAAATAGDRHERGALSAEDPQMESGEYSDRFTFWGAEGEHVVIDLRSQDFDPYLMLLSPDEVQEENDDHEGDPSRSLLSLSLPVEGEYTVVVTSYSPETTGGYELAIEHSTEREGLPSSRMETGSLASGDATLRSGEYVDSFDFQGRPGQKLHAELTSDAFDTYLVLVKPDGEQLENDDADRPGRSVIDADLTESGSYQLLVTSFEEGETGAYQLSLEVGGSPEGSGATRDVASLALGQSTQGTLEEGDGRLDDGEYRDIFTFDGEAGSNVVVEMSSSDFDTYLLVVGPDGEDVQNDDHEGDTSRSRVEMELQDSGRYRVVTTSYGVGETGSYRISLAEGGPSSPTGRPTGGRVFGLFAGISEYGGRAGDLPYTAEDATRLQDALIRGGGMEPGNGILLQDAEVTVANVRGSLQDLGSRMGPGDTFVFFYSGHGGRVPIESPQPSDPDALNETLELYDGAITDDEFAELLGTVPAGTTLVFLDACFSGGFSKDIISVPDRMGLFSSEEDVTSSVAGKFRAGGYLSVFLADAIGDRLADGDEDGQITAIELSQYVHERYRFDLKSGGPGDFVRTGGPQLGYQHLVVDRGSIGPRQVLFR